MVDFTSFRIMNVTLEVTSRYSHPFPVGMNMSGLVCSAKDQILHCAVAMKKISKPFNSRTLTKQALREIKLLRYLQHENIVSLHDVFLSPGEDLYIVTELAWTNLQKLLERGPIANEFSRYFLYQIFRGLKYVHSAGIIHRHLDPTNVLINENCDLKISDFSLARVQDHQMTGYVATRHYRAPEIMLTWQNYSGLIDIWSTACIFAEMLRGTPLFPGTSHVDQFHQIVNILGNPPSQVVDTIKNKHTRTFIQSLPLRKPKPLSTVFPGAEEEAIDLLERMLVFDAKERITAKGALVHPYMAPYHDSTDEPVVDTPFDWSFDNAETYGETPEFMVYNEVLGFRQKEMDILQGTDFHNSSRSTTVEPTTDVLTIDSLLTSFD